MCLACGQNREDLLHTFYNYELSSTWWRPYLPKLLASPQFTTQIDLLSWVVKMGSREDLIIFLCCSQSWWNRRNLHLFERGKKTHKEAFEHGLAILKNHHGNMDHRQVKRDLLKSKSPPTNCYKLNVDATLFFDLAKVGYGAIVHDQKGSPYWQQVWPTITLHNQKLQKLMLSREAYNYAATKALWKYYLGNQGVDVLPL